MTMCPMNLEQLSGGKDLAGVTQARPLPLLKNRRTHAACVHQAAFSFSLHTVLWKALYYL